MGSSKEEGGGGGGVGSLFTTIFIYLLLFYYACVGFKLNAAKCRLLLLLPLLPLYLRLPWLVSSFHIRAILSFIFLWTSPSKLLLLCFDSSIDPLPWITSHPAHFLSSCLLPIRIVPPHGLPHPPPPPWLWRLLPALLLLNLYPSLPPSFPSPLLYLLYSAHVYLGLELVLGALSRLMSSAFLVQLDPAFDNPLFSSSLSEFWGRRWNLVVTTLLRATVYDPMLHLLLSGTRKPKGPNCKEDAPQKQNDTNDLQEASDGHSGSNVGIREEFGEATKNREREKPAIWARAIAMIASFSVSGLLHELIFFYITRSKATWEVTAFFILHGFATAAEVALRRTLPSSLRMPRAVSVFFTLAFVYSTGAWLFMPPLSRSGASVRTIAEYHELQSWVLAMFNRKGSSMN